ncbi:alpha/beta hydrolase [Herbiconiux sp. VKM Ac-1786]|uniref:alpha/beta fold hydrolase n=1 Tax=Herbiconiux sp. VKM Ac-1786 TaxID=2783824 RepID=UPI00188CC3BE|nr:alpha/beta hydrolase [Herbiconiux sp. VKM Ac-1786]
MVTVHHRYVQIDGQSIYYREAGAGNPHNVLLLHGAPASSFMFRDLIPLLATKYHVIAPDYLGFGLSDAPPVDQFEYTFHSLARTMTRLTSTLGFTDYALYVQDYGAPVGWRMAMNAPEAVAGIITQNGNAYDDGFAASFWEPLWAYAQDPTAETEPPLRASFTEDAIRWQYLHGVTDPTLVSPDTWLHDATAANRPGVPEIHLALYRDYPANVALYPAVHEYFREHQPPMLVVWGAKDEIFLPAGAQAFLRDLPNAILHLRHGGHFLLESDLDGTASLILEFLEHLWDNHANEVELDPIAVPEPVASYLTRSQSTDPATALELLGETARITDGSTSYTGREQLLEFLQHASTEFTYTSSLLRARRHGPVVTITNRLDGDFPGGTVTLEYRFVIDADSRIGTLTIDT